MTYDGFISYSHAADGLLAPRLQAGLQRFAKPWWQRRALRVFRDESSLSANPHLWSSIAEALDSSEWFVLLLSPDSAASPWVNQEIEYWKANRDPSRILPVLTDGEFGWDGADVSGSAVPDQLRGVFAEEPRWVDLRFAKGETELDLKDPRFADSVADVASALRGVPKDELASEEVKQHRRTIRTAWAGAAVVGVLAVAATVFAFQSAENAQRAEAEAGRAEEQADRANQEADRAEVNAAAEAEARRLAQSRELAASAIGVVEEDPRLATWLALTAIEQTPDGADQPVEVINALWKAVGADPFVASYEHGFGGVTFVGLSPNGQSLAVSSAEGATVQLLDAESLDVIWSYSEETQDGFARPVFSPDGSLIAIDVVGSESPNSWRASGVDDLPNRVVILDRSSGELVHVLDFPECENVWAPSWSLDGTKLVVSAGAFNGCQREDATSPIWLEVFDTTDWESRGIISIDGDDVLVRGIFLTASQLGAFRSHNPLSVYDSESLELIEVYEEVASPITPAVSQEAHLIAAHSNETLLSYVYDLASGTQLDILGEHEAWPTISYGASFSSDGSMLAYATDGRVLVWDVGSGEQIYRLTSGAGALNAVFGLDGTTLYTAHRDGAVRVWDLRPGGSVVDPKASFPSGSFINGNGFFVGNDVGFAVRFEFEPEFLAFFEIFDASTGELIADPLISQSQAVVLPSDRIVWKPDESPRFEALDPRSGEVDLVGPDCVELDCSVVISSTGHQFAIVDEGGDQLVWHFFDSETLAELGTETHDNSPRLASGFGETWVLTGNRDGNFAFLSRATGEEFFRLDAQSGVPEFSNDGTTVALRPDGRTIVMIDTQRWNSTELDLGFGRMRGLTFSPDDSLLAVADEDEILIVDLDRSEIVFEIPVSLGSDIHWIDRQTLLVANRSGSLWGVVSLDVDVLIERSLQSVANRPLTSQECVTYRIDPCPSPESGSDE